jgi:hypothetical protein
MADYLLCEGSHIFNSRTEIIISDFCILTVKFFPNWECNGFRSGEFGGHSMDLTDSTVASPDTANFG